MRNGIASAPTLDTPPPAPAADEATAFTLDEAAERLRVNPETVARLVRAGKIRTVANLGRVRRIAFSELRRFVEASEAADTTTETPAPTIAGSIKAG